MLSKVVERAVVVVMVIAGHAGHFADVDHHVHARVVSPAGVVSQRQVLLAIY